MKNLIKLIVVSVGVLAMFSFSTSVSADENEGSSIVQPYVLLDTDYGVDEIVKSVNTISVKTDERFNMLKYELSNEKPKVSFNKKPYLKLELSERKKMMENTLTIVNNSSLGDRDKNRFITFLEDQDEGVAKQIRFLSNDTSVDIANASVLIQPFSGPIGIILGVIALLTLISLGLSVTIDLFYLTSPIFYAFCHRSTSDKPSFVTFEAYSSLIANETNINGGKNANYLGTYFKRRGVVMFVIGIAYTFLVTNNIYQFLGIISDVSKSIIEALNWY